MIFNCSSLLEIAQLGPLSWPRTKSIVADLLKEKSDDDSPPSPRKNQNSQNVETHEENSQELDARCKGVFASIANTLTHLYKMDMKFIACFRAAISKKIIKGFNQEQKGRSEVSSYSLLAQLSNEIMIFMTET